MNEVRSHERRRVLSAGRLLFGDTGLEAACMLRDLSDGGARVTLSGEASLPERMTLIVPARNISRPVTMRWRVGLDVGLTFADGLAEDANDPQTRIRQLEAENARLHAQIKALRAEIAQRIERDGG